ncbi:unnamed protein product, partial [Discosporangium mesarthrocarpum]
MQHDGKLVHVCSYDKLCLLLGSLDSDILDDPTNTTGINEGFSLGQLCANVYSHDALPQPLLGKKGAQHEVSTHHEVRREGGGYWTQGSLEGAGAVSPTVNGWWGDPDTARLDGNNTRTSLLGETGLRSSKLLGCCECAGNLLWDWGEAGLAGGEHGERCRGANGRDTDSEMSLVVVSSGSDSGSKSPSSVCGSEGSEISDSDLPCSWALPGPSTLDTLPALASEAICPVKLSTVGGTASGSGGGGVNVGS